MDLTILGKVRSGKREWLFQRLSNLSIVLWGIVFIVQVLLMADTGYAAWQGIFAPLWFKLYTSITLLIISLNSVLAGWQIGTDYVKKACVNRIFMALCIFATAVYTFVGLYVIWLL
ncbi:MAG: succinate dehydrogenase, hydrophobic membrane anchor protein [Oceanospirillaceae bacterium]|nr:succinate dehydrogenase, hydrophobic membrane anchor protein [Oceanospirillaceae bacterium]